MFADLYHSLWQTIDLYHFERRKLFALITRWRKIDIIIVDYYLFFFLKENFFPSKIITLSTMIYLLNGLILEGRKKMLAFIFYTQFHRNLHRVISQQIGKHKFPWNNSHKRTVKCSNLKFIFRPTKLVLFLFPSIGKKKLFSKK